MNVSLTDRVGKDSYGRCLSLDLVTKITTTASSCVKYEGDICFDTTD